MAFDGAFKAPAIVPSAFGLFSIFPPTNPTSGEKWVRGFDQWWDTTPSYVRVLDANYTSYTVATVDSNPTVPLYSHHIPFFIEVQDDRSTLGLLGEERMARVLRQLEGCSQKACELELWDGSVALQGSNPDLVNAYLAKGSSVTILPGRKSNGTVANPIIDGAAVSVKHGVSILESAIGLYSSAGEQGWIHITRDTAAVLSSYNQMVVDYYDPNKGSRQHLQTFGGTPLVVGSGYSGNGPVVNITKKASTGGTATLTTSHNHGLAVGDTVVITGVDSTFDGTYVTTGTTAAKTIQFALTGTVASVDATGTAQMLANGPVATITNKVADGTNATLTTDKNHGIAVGDTVVITGVDSTFNGTYVTITGTSGKTIVYALAVTVGTVATTGTAQSLANSRYKWIYASGEVRVYLGDSDLVNDSLGQGLSVSSNQNDMRIKATRPASVYFDTSIHLGVKVDLTLTN